VTFALAQIDTELMHRFIPLFFVRVLSKLASDSGLVGLWAAEETAEDCLHLLQAQASNASPEASEDSVHLLQIHASANFSSLVGREHLSSPRAVHRTAKTDAGKRARGAQDASSDARSSLADSGRAVSGQDTSSDARTSPVGERNPFRKAFVVSLEPERYKAVQTRLDYMGVPSEIVKGFNGSSRSELDAALELLTKYGNTGSLHDTVSNWALCMHMSPGKGPNMWAAFMEILRSFFHRRPQNVPELLGNDRHGCVPKPIAIAATHLRLWQDLATRTEEAEDPWYLVMEDDVAFCPNWRTRMLKEMPLLPMDADVVKLFFFGHWREQDKVSADNADLAFSPFLKAKDPLNLWEVLKASMYELLHGGGWSTVPTAGFYAGTQAYLLRPSGARKLLANINGLPFQDIDMTMMAAANNYVWRHVLVKDADFASLMENGKASLLQSGTVPTCNAEPAPDQWW